MLIKSTLKLTAPAVEKRPGVRLTVVMVFVCMGTALVVLPRTSRENEYVFPQGGVREGETLLEAVYREGEEEVKFNPAVVAEGVGPKLIGECLNPIPQMRGMGTRFKRLVFVAVHVRSRDWVALNEENRAYDWVSNPKEFLDRTLSLRNHRPVKFDAMRDAVNELAKQEFLGWSLKPSAFR